MIRRARFPITATLPTVIKATNQSVRIWGHQILAVWWCGRVPSPEVHAEIEVGDSRTYPPSRLAKVSCLTVLTSPDARTGDPPRSLGWERVGVALEQAGADPDATLPARLRSPLDAPAGDRLGDSSKDHRRIGARKFEPVADTPDRLDPQFRD